MYLFLMLIPFLLWFLLALTAHQIAKKSGSQTFLDCKSYEGGMFFAACFATVIFVIILVFNLMCFANQRANFNTLQKQAQNKVIYQHRMTNMTAQFKEILVKDYPEYEKAIFEKMTPDDASKLTQLLTLYPQLKSSVTMGLYAENIKELNDKIYDQEIEINATVTEIRWNYITPWLVTSLMPPIPPKFAKYFKDE